MKKLQTYVHNGDVRITNDIFTDSDYHKGTKTKHITLNSKRINITTDIVVWIPKEHKLTKFQIRAAALRSFEDFLNKALKIKRKKN